jgi:hypothetical protein
MAHRVDGNQSEIVAALRQVGASVFITSDVGKGFTDLVVAWRGVNYLLEIKDPTQPLRNQKLTPAEAQFHARWQGPIEIVYTPDDALKAIGFEVAV